MPGDDDNFKNAQNDVYLKTQYRSERGVEPRITLCQAIARFIADLSFPIDYPDPAEGITDYIPAVIGENLFYWLTSNQNQFQDGILKTRVTVRSEGVPVLFQGGRGQGKFSEQPGYVSITVHSSPRRAVDSASRLWSIFFGNVKFTAQRKVYDEDGACIGYKNDLTVQRAYPVDEPQVVAQNEDGLTEVVFRLACVVIRETEG